MNVLPFFSFDSRDSTKIENIKKLNKKYFITKILIFTKLHNPILETRVSKLVYVVSKLFYVVSKLFYVVSKLVYVVSKRFM